MFYRELAFTTTVEVEQQKHTCVYAWHVKIYVWCPKKHYCHSNYWVFFMVVSDSSQETRQIWFYLTKSIAKQELIAFMKGFIYAYCPIESSHLLTRSNNRNTLMCMHFFWPQRGHRLGLSHMQSLYWHYTPWDKMCYIKYVHFYVAFLLIIQEIASKGF